MLTEIETCYISNSLKKEISRLRKLANNRDMCFNEEEISQLFKEIDTMESILEKVQNGGKDYTVCLVIKVLSTGMVENYFFHVSALSCDAAKQKAMEQCLSQTNRLQTQIAPVSEFVFEGHLQLSNG